MVSISDLRDRLSYDPTSGLLTWVKLDSPNSRFVGQVAGTLTRQGYIHVRCNGRFYMAHRLAWAIHYGVWPSGQIDHINLIKSDNRIVNLRECCQSQNIANTPKAKGVYFSDFKGVYAGRRAGTWRASCKRIPLGVFTSEEEAARAYDRAAIELHGEFATLNFPAGG